MSISDTKASQKYASICEVSAAQVTAVLQEALKAPEYTDEAKGYAQEAKDASQQAQDAAGNAASNATEQINDQLAEQKSEFDADQVERKAAFDADQDGRVKEFNSDQQERKDSFSSDQQERKDEFSSDQSIRNEAFDSQITGQKTDFEQFLLNSGYQFIGDYEKGPFQFTARNQYIRYNNQYYRLNSSTSVGFTTTGITASSFANDVSHFVLMDGDVLRQSLAGKGGAGLVGLTHGGTVQDAIKYVTPWMHGAIGDGVNDDATAILAADAEAKSTNCILLGMGGTFYVGRSISLSCGYYLGMNLLPLGSYTGPAPDLSVNAKSGGAFLSDFRCSNFIARGPRVTKGSFTGSGYVYLKNTSFINNGGLQRTTTTSAVDTSKDFIINVANTSGFVVGDYVWIGDSKLMIDSISSSSITLINDGVKPTTYPGGAGTGSYSSGQFFTRDGDGRNGITIGTGGASMSIYTEGRNVFINNGWFGIYNYANTDPDKTAVFHVDNCVASNNGFIGIGAGRIYAGSLTGNVCESNGNNGIDINRGHGGVSLLGNACRYNGVDGIFTGCYDTSPSVKDNICESNLRIGILFSGSGKSSAPDVSGNTCNSNPKYNICMTGVSYAALTGNILNGISSEHIRIEGRDGRSNPSAILSENIFLTQAGVADIFGNFGGYVNGGSSGNIYLLNNRFSSTKPVINIINLNLERSRFMPEYYILATRTADSVAAGANIGVTITAYKPYSTGIVDVTAGIASLQLATSAGGLSVAPPSSISRNAGIEIASQLASGKIIASFNYGVITYGVIYPSAGTRYLHFNAGGNKSYIELVWS